MGKNKRICTIHTDASYDQFKQIGKCAFHASWEDSYGQQRMEQFSPVFPAQDSFHAELYGVQFALEIVPACCDKKEFSLYCDNMAVVNLLDSKNGIIHRDTKMKYSTIDKIKEIVLNNNYTIKTVFVKGHDDNNMSKASRLNRRVDMLSKMSHYGGNYGYQL